MTEDRDKSRLAACDIRKLALSSAEGRARTRRRKRCVRYAEDKNVCRLPFILRPNNPG